MFSLISLDLSAHLVSFLVSKYYNFPEKSVNTEAAAFKNK